MPVLVYKISTLYSADELQRLIELAVWQAAKETSGNEVLMLDTVSDIYDTPVAVKKLLARTQDLLLRDHGLVVDLTGADNDTLESLGEGTYVQLSYWILDIVIADAGGV